MPTRLGIKDVLFDYAWIDPEGRMKETGDALGLFRGGGPTGV